MLRLIIIAEQDSCYALECTRLCSHNSEFLASRCQHLLVLCEQIVDEVLQQLVSTEALASFEILDHQVLELIDVAGSFQNWVWRKGGAFDLQQVILHDKMLPPQADDVFLQGATGGSVIKQARNAAVNFERWNDDHSASNALVKRFSVHLPFRTCTSSCKTRESISYHRCSIRHTANVGMQPDANSHHQRLHQMQSHPATS
jgi:hypothetical protein